LEGMKFLNKLGLVGDDWDLVMFGGYMLVVVDMVEIVGIG